MSLVKNIIEDDVRTTFNKIDFSMLAGKTVLITGASGLLGVYFLTTLKLLNENGANVKTIAIFRSELPDYLLKEQFEGLQIYKGDITDHDFCKTLPYADVIIHAAGYGQPMKFMSEPEKTLKLNTYSTFLLFDRLNKDGCFLFISSSEVYSGLNEQVYTEDNIGTTNTSHPRACYIEGKRGGEAICYAYRSHGVNAHSIRLAHTYGPGTKKGDKRVILSFIEKALQGKIEMLDDGAALRTYCYIADAVEIMWYVLLNGTYPVYNLGGNSQTSIMGLAQSIGKIMNVPVIVPQSTQAVSGAPTDVQLDMTKVSTEFGKVDYIPLDEGLKRTIEWYLNINN